MQVYSFNQLIKMIGKTKTSIAVKVISECECLITIPSIERKVDQKGNLSKQ